MAEIRKKLGSPPITEALIDIRIVGAEPTQEILKTLGDSLKARFPKIEERRLFETTVIAGARGRVEGEDRGLLGYFLYSADAKTTVQLKKNGFTLNRLAPYTGGDQLVREALELWEQYVTAVKPEGVSRLAIRYINRIDLPLRDGDQLDRFLHSAPLVPEGLPQNVTDFVTRVVVLDKTSRVVAIVTQTLSLPDGGKAPFILDIDVFKSEKLRIAAAHLQEELELLRATAQAAFFGSLTEETVSLYI